MNPDWKEISPGSLWADKQGNVYNKSGKLVTPASEIDQRVTAAGGIDNVDPGLRDVYRAALDYRTASGGTSGGTTGGTTGGTSGGTSGGASGGAVNSDRELDRILSTSGLSKEEQQAIRSVYGAVSQNDQAEADRLIANLELGVKYADPILKQQVALMTDELKRGFRAEDEDFAYQEETLQNRLSDLRGYTERAGNKLSLDEATELRELERSFASQLEGLQDQMFTSGFTSSSRRNKKEAILSAQKGDFVESARRRFAAQRDELTANMSSAERDTQAEVERLRQLTTRDKTDLARAAESKLGSDRVSAMPELSGIQPVGGITGDVDFEYRNNASQFIF